MRDRWSSSNSLHPVLPPWKMPDTIVPGYRPTTSHSARCSSGRAPLAGTGLPSASMCAVEMSVENPSAPAASASPSAACSSGSVRSSAAVTFAVGTQHVPPQRRVPGDERGVETDATLERVEVLAEGLPRPRHALSRARRAACPSTSGHHPARVVGVFGVQRRQPERAVARRSPTSRRGRSTASRPGPRTAGRRSACADRRTPGTRPGRRRRASRGRVRRRGPPRRPGRRGRRRRRSLLALPVPSTTVAPSMR